MCTESMFHDRLSLNIRTLILMSIVTSVFVLCLYSLVPVLVLYLYWSSCLYIYNLLYIYMLNCDAGLKPLSLCLQSLPESLVQEVYLYDFHYVVTMSSRSSFMFSMSFRWWRPRFRHSQQSQSAGLALKPLPWERHHRGSRRENKPRPFQKAIR